MPRVANAPRGRDSHTVMATPAKSPIKIPLNDDKQEKASRFQSRQALHESQISQIRAAATPLRKRKSLLPGDPSTPDGQENELNVVGTAITPMKRVPILANFEEWMKMATDNKINAANSWNFALIDYFHDMSLLKEGDGVNFQRASCTLDGCVKIYTSRVDSVATETGKLLSGLADSGNNKKRKGDGEDDEEGSDGEEVEGEDGVKRKTKKKTQRHAEATLVGSFSQLQLKKMEMELAVDPLFKKASADFDEGGAKGLLLNHLAIDGNGRIVFDSSDDANDAAKGSAENLDAAEEMEVDEPEPEDIQIDISSLGAKFFPDLAILDSQDICPSLKNFDLGDPNGSLDLPFLKAPDDWRQEQQNKQDNQSENADGDRSGIFLDEDNAPGFDDDDGDLGGFELPPETGFGEGGEVWAREAAIEPQLRVHHFGGGEGDPDATGEEGIGEVGSFDPADNKYAVSLAQPGTDHENILNYFDQALSKNWAGPEHWKIRRIKDNSAKPAAATKRKEKEKFEIDFAAPMAQEIANALYTPATSNSTIQLPKKDWKSKTRNLLPDDKHFNSKQLLRLFLKPKARMGSRRPVQFPSHHSRNQRPQETQEDEPNEAYWATSTPVAEQEDVPQQGAYDADFFADDALGAAGPMDDDDDEPFADARDHFSPPAEDGMAPTSIDGVLAQGNQPGAFGAQLVTQSRRLRPEYVQYARVAKKVDVRKLKEEIWRGMALEDESTTLTTPSKSVIDLPKSADGVLKFTDVINSLQSVYPKQQMADISTSYCFICVLHLANEKGLIIENEPTFENLSIRRDLTADLSAGGD